MDELEDFLETLNIKKYLFNIVIIISFGLLCYFVIYKLNYFEKKINNNTNNTLEEKIELSSNIDNIEYVIVDIKGEVNIPGVYELIKGSRVIDVIMEASGLTENANTRYINLSKILNDGDSIIIYSNKEIEDSKKDKTEECICEEINSACIEENTTNSISNDLININTATKEQLMTLTGIGESKANEIIKYREENGNFKSIDEIINVNGISEKIFEKIKSNITI